ncbi:hypothetical protein DPMN_115348 [Dreissena polymorpha]|uniref:Uncharacterized protein n=1 Tax=Dreissena polymorpha TaxID=45954 RepID=A0A9D4KL13_DREPO|nr:hypothetical protein DPMN_115348 [Dreissena polymorpha]
MHTYSSIALVYDGQVLEIVVLSSPLLKSEHIQTRLKTLTTHHHTDYAPIEE